MSRRRLVVLLVAGVVGFVAILWVLREFSGGSPGGPQASSYGTAGDGVGAWADLLARDGHQIDQLRVTPSKASLEPGETAVVLDPPFVLNADAQALIRFVRAGGRLIAGGEDVGWLHPVIPGAFEAAAGYTVVRPFAPAPEIAGVAHVVGAGTASWMHPGAALPILGGDRAVAAVANVGAGRIVLLADDSPLENLYLGSADNARFALDIVGPPSRKVVFFENYHGYGTSSGFGAIPSRWQWLLGLGALASLVFLVSRWRRLGPPELERRELDPPRREYVEAMAGILARTRAPAEALAPLRAEARRRLAVHAARPLETRDALLEAAREQGLPGDEADAVAREALTGEDVLAIGRALARLGGDGRREWRG